jgi:hypothetical protein
VLLKRASGAVDVFVTMDANLEHQQNASALAFGIVVAGAPSNRMEDLAPLIPDMLAALGSVGRARSSTLAASRSVPTT